MNAQRSKCPRCDRDYKTRAVMTRHLREMHNISIRDVEGTAPNTSSKQGEYVQALIGAAIEPTPLDVKRNLTYLEAEQARLLTVTGQDVLNALIVERDILQRLINQIRGMLA